MSRSSIASRCQDASVAVKVGGMYVGGRSRDDNAVCQELRDLVGPVDFDDYVVDLCFMTYTADGLGSEYATGVGISPGMVGASSAGSSSISRCHQHYPTAPRTALDDSGPRGGG